MADNVDITAGTGTTIHADEYTHATFGLGKTQIIKVVFGAPGAGVDAVAGAGAVTTGVQRMTLASDDPAVAKLGTIDTSATAIAASASVLDDWDETDRAKVNLIVGQAGIAAGAGAVGVTVPRATLASDDPAVVALQIMDDWDSSDACKVSTSGKSISVTLTLDTAIYATGDVLADTQAASDCFRIADGTGILTSLVVIDGDDQKQAMDLLFFSANVSLGTENAAPSISDANAANFLGKVSVLESDYIDLGGVSVATIPAIGLGVKAASGTDDMYLAAISRGTGTYTASGVTVRLHVAAD